MDVWRERVDVRKDMDANGRTQALIAKAQTGDRAAFAALVSACRADLEAVIRSRLGPALRGEIQEEDILQEVSLRAFRGLGMFRAQDSTAFLRWLVRIAVNVIREMARRHRRHVIVPLTGDAPGRDLTQSGSMRRNERFDRLQGSLNALSPEHREVILLSRIERLPLKVVAERMGRSPDAVAHLLARALRKLKGSFGTTDSFHLPDRRLEDRGENHGPG
ncbi:MAG: sigma-70 family RNA polymerase sigma factor [Planctomycetes bacterium]|nr:sigma-70 family RNA polymerase sigma factor [Planctomycetota bacterium]